MCSDCAAWSPLISGADNPEAPISHPLGGFHIVGKIKIEGSVFRSHEPDQFRYNIETGKRNRLQASILAGDAGFDYGRNPTSFMLFARVKIH